MHPLPAEVLSRFHRALVEEIRETRPDYLTDAFTVAEIYQNLVPYRTHRDRIGVEMNGDYEDALLRLLAGEGDYLVLESEHARQALRAELESPNPNTGLFREYAALDVRLNPSRLPSSLAASPPGLFGESVTFDMGGDAPVPVEDLAPEAGDVAPEPEGEAPAPAVPSVDPSAARPGGEDASVPGACAWCRESLPPRETLNYCPFCGANLNLVPCPNCGEELETGWRFCVACGTEVQPGG